MRFAFATLLLIFSSTLALQGQNTPENKEQQDIFKYITDASSGKGSVTIVQDDQIKQLANRYIDSRKKENTIPGYRIRIYSNSGNAAKTNAYSERARFLKTYPDVPAYLEYGAPNFKVYVGDFRSKSEAFRAYKQIVKEFRNAFLVPARINLPKL